MRLHSVTLKNFRGFHDAHLEFAGAHRAAQCFALVGANGSGKSTVLDALATALSWIPARLQNPRGQGRHIDYLDIRREEDKAHIEVLCDLPGRPAVGWRLERAARGSGLRTESNYTDLQSWTETVTGPALRGGERSVPVLAYYPTNRAVLDIPDRIGTRHEFDTLSAYNEALTASSTTFRVFFEWFRKREDIENERRVDDPDYRDRQLAAVRRAIEALLPGYRDVRIRRGPQRMEVTKNGSVLRVDQLSDGEKCLLAMAGDLAQRLALANPTTNDPLEGKGVVLIDEVELHLHPGWQRQIVARLTSAFPGCQFLLSTHSPLVLGHIERDAVWLVDAGAAGREVHRLSTWGQDADQILEETLDTPTRPAEIQQRLDALFAALQRHDLQQADALHRDLAEEIDPDDPALIRASALRRRLDRLAG